MFLLLFSFSLPFLSSFASFFPIRSSFQSMPTRSYYNQTSPANGMIEPHFSFSISTVFCTFLHSFFWALKPEAQNPSPSLHQNQSPAIALRVKQTDRVSYLPFARLSFSFPFFSILTGNSLVLPMKAKNANLTCITIRLPLSPSASNGVFPSPSTSKSV